MGLSFRHVINEAEAEGCRLNLKDDRGQIHGHSFPPHKTALVVLDQLGRRFHARKHVNTQMTALTKWFRANAVTAGTIIQIRYDPSEELGGQPVVHLEVLDHAEADPVASVSHADASRPRPQPASVTAIVNVLDRDSYLERVQAGLEPQLSGSISSGQVVLRPGRNYLQVTYSEFPSSHYELWLARETDEVGFHFEGKRDLNLARLTYVQGHLDELKPVLGDKVIAVPWGTSWARVGIQYELAPYTAENAQLCANRMVQFIRAAHPILQGAFVAVPSRRGRQPVSVARPEARQDSSAHQILDKQIDHIRRYLCGRADRPSDEVLCDWVQLCYTLELHHEAVDVFNLIDPSAVHEWPYARAKRLAQVCRLHARR